MLIQLAGRTLHSENCGSFRSDNDGTGHLFKVTHCKFKKLIQPVLILLVCRTLHSDNGCILRSDNGGTGHLSKVTGSKLKKLPPSTYINTKNLFNLYQ